MYTSTLERYQGHNYPHRQDLYCHQHCSANLVKLIQWIPTSFASQSKCVHLVPGKRQTVLWLDYNPLLEITPFNFIHNIHPHESHLSSYSLKKSTVMFMCMYPYSCGVYVFFPLLQVPSKIDLSFQQLLDYLVLPFRTDMQKVRALFMWLCVQPITTTKYKNLDGYTVEDLVKTPRGFMKLIKEGRASYASLFAVLCR